MDQTTHEIRLANCTIGVRHTKLHFMVSGT